MAAQNGELFTVSKYEPAPRTAHASLFVNGNLYLWGGNVNGLLPRPCAHESPDKRQLLSSVDVFRVDYGDWIRQMDMWNTSTGSEWLLLCCSG